MSCKQRKNYFGQRKAATHTCNECSARSVTGSPPKSKKESLLRVERRMIPFAVNPDSGMNNFFKLGMDKRCSMPASVTFEHLDRSNSFRVVIPKKPGK